MSPPPRPLAPSVAPLSGHRPVGLPVDPRFRRRWAEARRAEGRHRLRILVSVLGVVAVLGLLASLIYTPVFEVRSVVVTGNSRTPAEQVIAAAGLARRGVLMVHAGTAQEIRAVEALPWVATVSFHRHWPWTVVVSVSERSPVALVAMVGTRTVSVPGGEEHAAGLEAAVDSSGRVLETGAPPEGIRTLPVLLRVSGAPPGAQVQPAPGQGAGQLGVLLEAAAAAPAALAARGLELDSVKGLGLVGYLRGTQAVVVLGDGSELALKLAVLEELAERVDLAGYSQVELTVPDRPALTPAPSPSAEHGST
ncbi:MAG TPA: FtsQ-type POTRA domain-containing protein [Acidimicrobiales bacterium]|nr:FtsQ-type POTRA domain-containing protein [Acidimicrobiales bacterium]